VKKNIPFYEKPRERKSKEDEDNHIKECIEMVGTWAVKMLALGGCLALAIIYDGSWLYYFFGLATALLGVEVYGGMVKRNLKGK
jgi:hypothetical protein